MCSPIIAQIGYRWAYLDTVEEKAKSTSDNVFNTIPSPFTFDVKVYESKAQFLQSNKSSEFIGGEDEDSQ